MGGEGEDEGQLERRGGCLEKIKGKIRVKKDKNGEFKNLQEEVSPLPLGPLGPSETPNPGIQEHPRGHLREVLNVKIMMRSTGRVDKSCTKLLWHPSSPFFKNVPPHVKNQDIGKSQN